MAEDRIKNLSNGKIFTKSSLYDTYLKQYPEDKGKITPDQVWAMHADAPESYQVMPPQDLTQGAANYVKETISNIPGSAWNTVKGIGSMFMPSTYAGLASIARGGVYSDMPKEAITPDMQQDIDINAGFKAGLAERYGHPLNTIKTDPVGAMADISAVLGGGSAVTRGLSRIPALSKLGTVATVTGAASDYTNPFKLLAEGTRVGLSKTGLAPYLYRSALVPLGDQSIEDIDNAVNFGLKDAKVIAGRKGRKELQRRIDEDVKFMDAKAQEAEAAGLRFDPVRAATEMDASTAEAQRMTFPRKYSQAIQAKKQEFLEDKGHAVYDPKTGAQVTPPSDISPTEAREMWKSQNREIGNVMADQPEDLTATLTSIRSIRKAVTDQFREWFPELKDIGQRDAMMIDLRNMIEAEIKRGMGANAPHSSVYALAHTGNVFTTGSMPPIAAATFAKHLFTPELRSRVALRIANKYPGMVQKYATPSFVAAAASAIGSGINRSAEPPTPPQSVNVGGDWMQQVPEAHR